MGRKQILPITVSQHVHKNEYKRQYYKLKKNPAKSRKDWLWWKYKLTEENYEKLLKEQNGCCAICDTEAQDSLHVDHDHTTGIIRGLLCHKCNKGLGLFKDNLRSLERAIDYLSRKR